MRDSAGGRIQAWWSGGGFSVWAVPGIPEVTRGDDLVALIANATGLLQAGDIVVVSSKIVSKAEGRQKAAADREETITEETVRVVASRVQPGGGLTRIVENRLGIVGAAAGVDASNVPAGTVLRLPVDPDASARALCTGLRLRFGVGLGVLITDTLGRPWRIGQTDIAIGAAGVRVAEDLRGSTDSAGNRLEVTIPAVADELAAAADLVKGKAAGLPVAVVRGLGRLVGDLNLPGARSLVRSAEQDMFRLGSDEAYAAGFRAGVAARNPSVGPAAGEG